jgi:hypothetical protein
MLKLILPTTVIQDYDKELILGTGGVPQVVDACLVNART